LFFKNGDRFLVDDRFENGDRIAMVDLFRMAIAFVLW
jgi:hypothetical protein